MDPYLSPAPSSSSSAHHRRPILAPSSSFLSRGESAAGPLLSPPPTPSRAASATAARRRRTSPDAGPASSSSSSSSSLASTSAIQPSSTSRPMEKALSTPQAAAARGWPDKGKAREVISWAEGLDRALQTMGGRDAGMKLVQYLIRTLVFVARLRGGSRGFGQRRRPGDLAGRLEQLDAIQTNISFTRRAFYFASSLGPSLRLFRPPKSLASILPDALSLGASVADDLWTLHKLGVVGRKVAYPAAEWANRLWLYSIVVGLSHLAVSTPVLSRRIAQLESASSSAAATVSNKEAEDARAEEEWVLRKTRSVEVWKAVKYWLDLVYVSYDVFHLGKHKDAVQMLTGLGAAGIAVRNSVETQRLSARG